MALPVPDYMAADVANLFDPTDENVFPDTYRAGGAGDGTSIYVRVSQKYARTANDVIALDSQEFALLAQESDMPAAAKNDTHTIDGTTYTVKGLHRIGAGLLTLVVGE